VQLDLSVTDRHAKHVTSAVVTNEVERHREVEKVAVAVRLFVEDRLDKRCEPVVRLFGCRCEMEDCLADVLDAATVWKLAFRMGWNGKRRSTDHRVDGTS